MSSRIWLRNPPLGVGIVVALLLALAASQSWDTDVKKGEQPLGRYHYVVSQDRVEANVPPVADIETPSANPKPNRDEWRLESGLEAQWKAANWNAVSAIASCLALVVAILGVLYVKRTLDSNVAAVAAAEKAILVENRPWIKFSVSINGNPTINDYGMTFCCEIKLTNTGNGPAKIIGVTTGELDFFADDLLSDMKRWIDQHMAIARKHPNEQEIFFPDETYTTQQYPRMSRELFDNHIAVIPDRKTVTPVPIFGVFYKAAIGEDIFYTVAAYTIIMPDTERGVSRAIQIDETGKVDGRSLAIHRRAGLSRAI